MRLISVKLKGFKGTKRGMGVDELEIDFSGISETGLVAFVGLNGSGKSTVLDNLHPYRVAPSRSNRSFYDLCEGSDALKEVIFAAGGCVYRSSLLIDAERKKQEAYLYKKEDGAWKPITNGRAEQYDAAIEEILGSPDLFFISSFSAQNAKPLSAYTKGELKEVFEDLLALGTIREKGEKAREVRKYLLGDKERLQAEMLRLNEAVREAEPRLKEKKEVEEQIGFLSAEILKIQKEVSIVEASLHEIAKAIAQQETAVSVIERLGLEASGKAARLETLKASLKAKEENYGKKAVEKKAKLERARKIAANGHAIREKVEEEKLAMAAIEEERASIALFEAKRDAVRDIEKAKAEASKLTGLPCVKTGLPAFCRFVKDAVAAKESIFSLERVALDIKGASSMELPAIIETIDRKKKRLSTFEANLKDIRKLISFLPELEAAENTIEEMEGEIQSIENERDVDVRAVAFEISSLYDDIKSVRIEISEKERLVDRSISGMFECKKREKAENEGRTEAVRTKLSALHARLGAINEALRVAGESGARMEELKTTVDFINQEISEWALLEKALGREGVIALEIDDAGPAISGLANDLLNRCFGSKFAVKIETTRPKKDGSGAMEVFDIKVIDAGQGEEKSLIDLSGGEKVWIEDAIAKAISLYNHRGSGIGVVKTLFTDEKDGALDHQKKREYLLMKKRVLEIGGYEREFFITHSPELQDMADARIVFERGGVVLM